MSGYDDEMVATLLNETIWKLLDKVNGSTYVREFNEDRARALAAQIEAWSSAASRLIKAKAVAHSLTAKADGGHSEEDVEAQHSVPAAGPKIPVSGQDKVAHDQ